MSASSERVVGIDVGGEKKGYHAVAFSGVTFVAKIACADPKKISRWCVGQEARVAAVDAPSCWSRSGSSRLCERKLPEQGISCFYTPTRTVAKDNPFYRWVFNGESLYKCLKQEYPLFDGRTPRGPMCVETFPYAVLRAIIGNRAPAQPRGKVRRGCLQKLGYDVSSLPNMDFVDVALCAVAADSFCRNEYHEYGDKAEGFIIVPKSSLD